MFIYGAIDDLYQKNSRFSKLRLFSFSMRSIRLSTVINIMILFIVDKEGVASFLKLLLSMLDNSPTNQQVFFLSEGPATIGALLQKVPPSCLTVQALTAIQQLTEQFSQHSEQRYGVYKHLLFNFKIWSRPSFSVRIG